MRTRDERDTSHIPKYLIFRYKSSKGTTIGPVLLRGRQVPHGVYFYRLDTPGFRDVKKAVVAR